MNSPIVTLTTDWGGQSFFSGMVKALLTSQVEGVRVMDITHGVEPFNVMAAAFVVRHGCLDFPPGTVHIVDVASHQPFLCVKVRGQYFLCCDDGLPTMAFGDEVEDVVQLRVPEGVYNFAAYSVFAHAAVRLLQGTPMSDLGEHPAQLLQRNMPRYIQQDDKYFIYVHYIDSYGNAYLGMTYDEFEQLRAGRQFVLTVRDQEVTRFSAGYYLKDSSNDPRRRLCLTVSVTGQLEVAIGQGSLAQLIGVRINQSVTLRFKDN